MYGSAIPDGLHNLRCGKHCSSAFPILGDILKGQSHEIFCIRFFSQINSQSWALALYFQVRSAHFLSKDRYRSSAHFANFQVHSSLNRSKKNSGSLLEKSAKMLDRS